MSTTTLHGKKESSDKLSALASKAMRGEYITQAEIKSLAASVLSQDETKGLRNKTRASMKTMPEIFLDVVEQLKARSGLMDPINSFSHPLNSITHPLNSISHPLNSIMHPNRGIESARILQKLLDEYVR